MNKKNPNNSIIIMPMGLPWDWTTDYYEQTARILSQNAVVFCVDLYSVEHVCGTQIGSIFSRRTKKIIKNLYLYRPIDIVPFRRFGCIRVINKVLQVFFVMCTIYCQNPLFIKRKIIVWICDPRFAYFASILRYVSTIMYDIVDFNQGIQPTNDEKSQSLRDDLYITKIADVVSVNSRTLFSIYKRIRRDIILVPQGFRLSQFITMVSNSPKIGNSYKKNIIGFVGGINYRLDYHRILEVAKLLPECLFVLVGKIQLDVEEKIQIKILDHITTLQRMPNVRIITDATKDQIPSIIKTFDIGIIPYDDSLTFNRYCFPMKLLEYFYFGKPVVSSLIHELKYYPKYVQIARTKKEWIQAIRESLLCPPTLNMKRSMRTIATSHSWESKLNLLSKCLSIK